jgi:hypothetical protein
MPKFKVVQERDAIIRFETEVEAETPEAAWEHARNRGCPWVDAAHYPLDRAHMAVYDLSGAELFPSREVW